jgi:hypothetical protein
MKRIEFRYMATTYVAQLYDDGYFSLTFVDRMTGFQREPQSTALYNAVRAFIINRVDMDVRVYLSKLGI